MKEITNIPEDINGNRNQGTGRHNERTDLHEDMLPGDQKTYLIDALRQAGQRDYRKLTLSDLAQITQTPLDEITPYFQSTDDWIDAYYCELVEQYQVMVQTVPDFENYTVGEKLLNFCLTSMDMMRDHEQLVRSTYHPFILDRFTSTRFEQMVADLFRGFTEQDCRVAMTNQLLLVSPVYTWWSREYLHMTGYWLSHPGSDHQVMALTEKTTSLMNEILYNGVFDKTLDLGKYLFEAGLVSPWTPVSVIRKFLRF